MSTGVVGAAFALDFFELAASALLASAAFAPFFSFATAGTAAMAHARRILSSNVSRLIIGNIVFPFRAGVAATALKLCVRLAASCSAYGEDRVRPSSPHHLRRNPEGGYSTRRRR